MNLSQHYDSSEKQFCWIMNVHNCWRMYFVQKIEEAAEKGELNELVLMVIWNRLDLARRDVSGLYHLFFLS